jgi:L-amino acid N-acyltransferase YncA
MCIRLADPERDGPGVAAIYATSVTASVASFELEPPDPAEMAARIGRTLAWSPWLVAESDGRLVGYAYATRHRERAGYRWAVDLSVYVAAARQGSGIGRRLYGALLPILRAQGFLHAYAGITPPNPASLALHAAIGMTPVGTFERVGYKLGSWWSVTWLGVQLVSELPTHPSEPIPLPALLATPEGGARVQAILDGAGLSG